MQVYVAPPAIQPPNLYNNNPIPTNINNNPVSNNISSNKTPNNINNNQIALPSQPTMPISIHSSIDSIPPFYQSNQFYPSNITSTSPTIQALSLSADMPIIFNNNQSLPICTTPMNSIISHTYCPILSCMIPFCFHYTELINNLSLLLQLLERQLHGVTSHRWNTWKSQ